MNRRSKTRLLSLLLLGVVVVAATATVVVWRGGSTSRTVGPGASQAVPEAADAEPKLTATVSRQDVGSEPERKDVLRSSLAGTWYRADANALRADIAGYFQKATGEPCDDIVALILPHAGYAYSGATAASGLKLLGKSYSRVIIIGPSHRLPMEEMFSVPRATHYETPLGQVPVDTDFVERLLAYPVFQNVPAAHEQEHSVQIEIPLLQYKLGQFKLVPIVAGQCTYPTVEKAGQILASLLDPNTLVVASSDFTHYGPQYQYTPFADGVARENIKKLDMGACKFIEKLDARGLLAYRQQTGATICGCVPIAVLLSTLGQGMTAQFVNYTTSGELAGDYTNSVSYLAVAFHGAWRPPDRPVADVPSQPLTQQDKTALLSLARQAVKYGLDHQKVPQISDLDVTITEAMRPPRAAFVTLKKHGQLRGCIGDIFPQRPLYMSVLGNAIYAAFGDRRFRPLQPAEYGDIEIEISALTVPSPVASPYDIRIGTDGMVLNKDGHSAVFLPQVAPEQGWDLATTLTQLSIKAGLEPDAWKEGASFQVFQAEVFGEEE